MTVPLCNGSTTDSGSVCLGSNPSGTTYKTKAAKILILTAFVFCLHTRWLRKDGVNLKSCGVH